MKNLHKIVVLSLLLITVLACSVKKDKVLNRSFHAVTARYNKYFNAEVLFNETLDQYRANTKEDFGGVLNIREIGTADESKALYAPMGIVIEKCSDVVRRHSMKLKGKEKNPWVDETFLLLGKAHFYKQDYESASVIFNYGSNFNSLDEKVTHMVWSAETQVMLGNYSVAERTLEVIIEEEDLKNKHKIHILQTQAEMYKRQFDYDAAAIALEKTIKYLPSGSHKTRNLFIIGQLFYEAGKYDLANEYFVEVGRKGRDYEFVFNALLYQARSFDEETSDPDEIISGLNELADLPRNKDYKDQIYFAKGQLYEKIEEIDLSLNNYESAIDAYVDNDKQLVRSHLAKGELEFKESNYELAQDHYDAVMELIDENYPNYRLIKEKWNALSNLAQLYSDIDWMDSLLIVSNWSETQQLAFATSVAEREKAAKEAKAKAEQEKLEKLNALLEKNSKSKGGNWYFSNAELVEKGKKIFSENWGFRNHEEHWRRKNKEKDIVDEEEEFGEDVVAVKDTSAISELDKRIQEILAEIPETEAEKDEMIAQVAEAYYELGMIYKEQLDDFDEAISVFVQLLDNYTDFERKPATYYQLFRLYALQDNKEKATYYRDLILTDYSNTEYSDLVQKIKSNTQAQKDEDEKLYLATYTNLQNGNTQQVITTASTYIKTGSNDDLKPRFAFLSAEAYAKQDGREAYLNALKAIVKDYPDTEQSTLASARLSMLESESSHFNLGLYDNKLEGDYYLVFLIEGENIVDIKNAISNFKNAVFKNDKLVMNTVIYDKSYRMVSLKLFSSVEKTFEFIKTLQIDPTYASFAGRVKYTLPVKSSNYSTFYKRKNLDEYQAFYDKYFKSFE